MNQKNYDTMIEDITDLQNKGYSYDFNLTPDCLECASLNLQLHPEDFHVDETYRFEGMSNPDDNSILFAISSKGRIRGILVDA
jgi:hypothetical protein